MKGIMQRSLRFYLVISLLILLGVGIVSSIVIDAIEKDRVFSFSSESSYWPTEGWRTSTPEKQGMDSTKLAELFEAIKKPTLSRKIRDKIVEIAFDTYMFDALSIKGILVTRI
jgi:hypothetical protein